jgi:hypothetical protein
VHDQSAVATHEPARSDGASRFFPANHATARRSRSRSPSPIGVTIGDDPSAPGPTANLKTSAPRVASRGHVACSGVAAMRLNQLGERSMKTIPGALALALVVATAGAAHAFPSWMQDDKAGRFMFNLKIGPAPTVKTAEPGDFKLVPFALVLDFGVAVDGKRRAYLLFSLQFHLHDQFNAVIVPFGFQYDIPIPRVPGLYITPRALVGYAAVIPSNGFNGNNVINTAFLEFAGGAKFVFGKRWNVGFEPFGLTVALWDNGQLAPGASGTSSVVAYRLLWYGGANF